MKIVVAGVGNVLRGDDGFGVAAAQRLLEQALPREIHVMDVGIGGIHLVQELLDSTDGLIVLDAVDFGRDPGTVLVVRPDVHDVTSLPLNERRDELADMHWSTPERAFKLARALGVLPEWTWIVGCQPADAARLGEGLSPAVSRAIGPALEELRALIQSLGIAWTGAVESET